MSARRNHQSRVQRHNRNQWRARAARAEEVAQSPLLAFLAANNTDAAANRSSRFGARLERGGFSPHILVSRRRAERPRKSYDLSGLKVAELRDLASRRGLKGYYNMKKPALIKAITESRY